MTATAQVGYLSAMRRSSGRAVAGERRGDLADPRDCGRRGRRTRPCRTGRASARTASPGSRRRARSPPASSTRRGHCAAKISAVCLVRNAPEWISTSGQRIARREHGRDSPRVLPAAFGQRALVVVLPDGGLGFGVTDQEQAAHGRKIASAVRRAQEGRAEKSQARRVFRGAMSVQFVVKTDRGGGGQARGKARL